MERTERDQINRVVDHEVKEHFPAGAVRRAVLLWPGDDPAIEPGQLMVRVFVEPPDGEEGLAAWRDANRAGIDELRRKLSLQLPSARLLEFAAGEDPGAPRLTVPDDGTLADQQMSAREIVTKAMALLRANYVSPELAGGPPPRSRPGWPPASTTAWTRSRSPSWSPATCKRSPVTGTWRCASAAARDQVPGPRQGRTGSPGTARRGGRRCAGSGGCATSASAGWSGWTATSATSTCAGWPCRPPPGLPSRRRWNWSPGPTRWSSTCGATGAARRTAWRSGAATCSTRSRPTSTTSSTPIPGRPGSSGRCPTCRATGTSTARSTC